MITVRPLQSLRPVSEKASDVASPPYDVLNADEAREKAKNNPISFLHVNKPEIDLPRDVDPHDDSVYQKASENLQALIRQGVFIHDQEPCFYTYHMKMGSHVQTGLVAVTSTEEYRLNKIKKHEHTKPDKESDRLQHILSTHAQCGPVILMVRSGSRIINWLKNSMQPDNLLYDVRGDNQTQHTLYRISEPASIKSIQKVFETVDALYIADGHHRSAAACRATEYFRSRNPEHTGEEPYNFFLSVIFPDDQLQILDYNRVVRDLNGLSTEELSERLSVKFHMTPYVPSEGSVDGAFHPDRERTFGMYLDGQWYKLVLSAPLPSLDPVDTLDVSILQNHVLQPLLGIDDPRTDSRIHFVGGIRGLGELERLVDRGDFRIAFSMFPTPIDHIIRISDAGKVMPPKSTWFEPKLLSGLLIHPID